MQVGGAKEARMDSNRCDFPHSIMGNVVFNLQDNSVSKKRQNYLELLKWQIYI